MDQKFQSFMQTLKYIVWMRPVFDMDALFSDETENYVTPMEPKPGDTVQIRFRTKCDNVDGIYLISGAMKQEMRLESSEGKFDYYVTELKAGTEPIRYYFEIRAGQLRCFYNKLGVSRDLQQNRSFCIVPGFSTPDWAKGAVMYQIFTDRFCNGDPTNDVEDREYVYIGESTVKVRDWNQLPAVKMGIREFYGGDLQGVLDKLDYLQGLGVEVVYFNPLFVSPSNHKYDIQDYDYIDPHFGTIVSDEGELLKDWERENKYASRYIRRVTDLKNLEASNQLFIRLVEELHRRGMRVILDGVFNHCGSFNKWMDRERIYENREGYAAGAHVSADSPYRSFFKFHNEHEWPYNPFYDGWWGHDTLPKLNYEDSPKLEEYILKIAAKWVSPPYNVDGWRLDVAADLGFSQEYNHEFWRKFRRAVKTANPDAVIMAEHYGEAESWLRGDQWDTIMNYDAFMEPLTWFFTGMEKHSDDYQPGMYGNADSFFGAMNYHMASFLAPSLQTAMNELSNHDHSRFLTRTNHKVGRAEYLGSCAASEGVRPEVMREAVVMQMTWPGAPTLYYGDEAGVCGFTDPDNRRTYPWGHEDSAMIEFYRAAIRLHRSYPVLKHGSLRFLHGSYNCLSYGRFSRTEQVIVIFNNNEEERQLEIPVWLAGVPKNQALGCIFYTDACGFSADGCIGENETNPVWRSASCQNEADSAPPVYGVEEEQNLSGELPAWNTIRQSAFRGEISRGYGADAVEPYSWTAREMNTAETSAWTLRGSGSDSVWARQDLEQEDSAWARQDLEQEGSDWTEQAESEGMASPEGKAHPEKRVPLIWKTEGGRLTITLPATSSVVLWCKNGDPKRKTVQTEA